MYIYKLYLLSDTVTPIGGTLDQPLSTKDASRFQEPGLYEKVDTIKQRAKMGTIKLESNPAYAALN